MTTQQPTQPEATQDPVVVRVGKLEGVSEQMSLRLKESTEALNTMRTENHLEHESLRAEIKALSDKVDRQGESHRAEMNKQGETHRAEIGALSDKVDRQGETLSAEMNKQGESHRAEIGALSEKVDRQGEALNEKIDRQGETLSDKIDRQGEALNAKIDTMRAEMHRQTYWILGTFVTVWATTVGAFVALFLAM